MIKRTKIKPAKKPLLLLVVMLIGLFASQNVFSHNLSHGNKHQNHGHTRIIYSSDSYLPSIHYLPSTYLVDTRRGLARTYFTYEYDQRRARKRLQHIKKRYRHHHSEYSHYHHGQNYQDCPYH